MLPSFKKMRSKVDCAGGGGKAPLTHGSQLNTQQVKDQFKTELCRADMSGVVAMLLNNANKQNSAAVVSCRERQTPN